MLNEIIQMQKDRQHEFSEIHGCPTSQEGQGSEGIERDWRMGT